MSVVEVIVQKSGGTSVADVEKIKNVARRVIEEKKKNKNLVVVVSAMGSFTDSLLSLSQEVSQKTYARELDMLLSSGEQISIALLAMAIQDLGLKAISFNATQIGFKTDSIYNKAHILQIETDRLIVSLKSDHSVIVAGFQGINDQKDITTLGRGGSDLSAIALAFVLNAQRCEIYTDVEGVYTADPRLIKNARKLKSINYEEMLELSNLGAKVLHSRAVGFAQKYGVDIHVRSSFSRNEGTLITKEVEHMEDPIVTGIALSQHEAKLTITGVPDCPGMVSPIFTAMAEAHINVDVIIQNISMAGYTDVSFTVFREDLGRAMEISEKVVKQLKATDLIVKKNIAKVSIVGFGIKRHCGVAAKMFGALADRGINIEMISTSDIKISCVINEKDGAEAVRCLHDAFGLEKVS